MRKLLLFILPPLQLDCHLIVNRNKPNGGPALAFARWSHPTNLLDPKIVLPVSFVERIYLKICQVLSAQTDDLH